jgi:hypothetical protein
VGDRYLRTSRLDSFQLEYDCGGQMADGSTSSGVKRRKMLLFEGRRSAGNPIDASMNDAKATGRESMADHPRVQAERPQLLSGYESILLRRDERDPVVQIFPSVGEES